MKPEDKALILTYMEKFDWTRFLLWGEVTILIQDGVVQNIKVGESIKPIKK
jgi:hypothetical protein